MALLEDYKGIMAPVIKTCSCRLVTNSVEHVKRGR